MNASINSTAPRSVRTVVENRQARHLYDIEDTFEAGLKVKGWEVKAILAGQANFNGGGSFVRITNGEVLLESLTVTPLPQARKGLLEDLDPNRPRTLLLRKSELTKLQRRVTERGYTLVPLALTYGRLLKVTLGLAKGKKKADKRETLKDRDQQRDLERSIRDRGL